MNNEKMNSKIKLLNNLSFVILTFVILKFGWESKFRMTKCRTTDISKFQNCEY